MASRSLGTLTLDLIAETAGFTAGLTKAERESAKWRKQVEKDLEKVGKVAGAAIGAAVVSVGAMTAAVVTNAREIQRFSQLAGASTTEFQRYAAGAEAAGLSQEKLADQLKDFNEKVGEFQRTGGGGMRDFFEQVAPKIGLTADAFRGLSGPEGLQLYYDSLEKAGLSQKEMSFYLESMASDTTALIPLLADGGRGFKELGDRAEAAGVVMDEKAVKAASDMATTLSFMNQQAVGARNTFVTALLPAVLDIADAFAKNGELTALASQAGEGFGKVLQFIARAGIGAYASVELTSKAIAGVAAVIAEADLSVADLRDPATAFLKIAKAGIMDKGGQTTIVLDDIRDRVNELAGLLDRVSDGALGGLGENIIREIEEARLKSERALRGTAGEPIAIAGGGKSGGTAKSEKIRQEEDALREYWSVVAQLMTDEERINATLAERLDLLGKTAEATEQDFARAIDAAFESMPADAEQLSKWYADQLARLEAYRKDRLSLNEFWSDKEVQLEEGYREQLKKNEEARKAAYDKEALSAYAGLVAELRTEEERQNDKLRERLAILDAMPTAKDQDYSRAIGAAFDEAPGFGGLAPEVGGVSGELAKIGDAEAELEGWYSAQLGRLAKFRQEKSDLNAEWDEVEVDLAADRQKRLDDLDKARQVAFFSGTSEMFGNVANLTKMFAGEQSKEYKAMLAVAQAFSIAQATMKTYESATSAYSAFASIPYVGPALGAAAAAAAIAAGLANVAQIRGVGMAHDGIDAVPKTGTWLLEKGERVVTSETSAKLDRKLDDMGSGQGAAPNVRIVNAFDSAVVGDYLGSDPGERAILNVVRRNASTIKQLAAR